MAHPIKSSFCLDTWNSRGNIHRNQLHSLVSQLKMTHAQFHCLSSNLPFHDNKHRIESLERKQNEHGTLDMGYCTRTRTREREREKKRELYNIEMAYVKNVLSEHFVFERATHFHIGRWRRTGERRRFVRRSIHKRCQTRRVIGRGSGYRYCCHSSELWRRRRE